jgi:hypothetical protein
LKKKVIVITVSQKKKKGGIGVGETSCLLVGNKQIIAPSVRLSAIRNNANGGIPKRALSVAKAAERKTNGATILKIWSNLYSASRASAVFPGREEPKGLTRRVAIKNGLNIGTNRKTGSK